MADDDAWDEIREIIGHELFDELTVESQFTEAEHTFRNLDEETEEHISKTSYHIVAPVDGDLVLTCVSALFHFVDEGCESCEEYLIGFAATFIGQMWSMVMESAGIQGFGGTNE